MPDVRIVGVKHMTVVRRKRSVIGSAAGLEANERQIEISIDAGVRTSQAVERRAGSAELLGIHESRIVAAKPAVGVIDVKEVIIRQPFFEDQLHRTITA